MGFKDWTEPALTPTAPRADINVNFSKGKNNQFQTDKVDPDSLQEMVNFYHKGGNAVLRNGYKLFASLDDILALGMYNSADAHYLVGYKADGANSKIVNIDRSDASESDIITGLVAKGEFYHTSNRGNLWVANGGDTNVHYYDGTASGTISFDYGGGAKKPLFLASDNRRVWGVCDTTPEQVLIFSNDRASDAVSTTTFTAGASTSIQRAGIADSKISNFTGLLGVAGSIVAFARDQVEVFQIPDFAAAGLTEFAAYTPLIKKVGGRDLSYEKVGVEYHKAAVAVKTKAYFIGKSKVLTSIDVSTGRLKEYPQIEEFMKDKDVSKAVMVLDQERDLIYISCRKTSDYDTTVVFNVAEENFATFENINAKDFVADASNIYSLGLGGDIFDCFAEDIYTDNGLDIDWEVMTPASWGGSLEFWKKAHETFLHMLVFSKVNVNLDFIVNRGIDAEVSPDKSIARTFAFVVNPFSPNPQMGGQGSFGGANVKFDLGNGTEQVYNNDKINVPFARYELRVRGSSNNALEIKGLGLKYSLTQRKIKDLLLES